MGGARATRKPRNTPWQRREEARKARMPDTRAARIRIALEAAFASAEVTVTDDSAQHAGHAGARPGGQTHYSVAVVSPAFAGMSRVARSRAVHEALAGEFATGLHALALRLHTPEEAARQTPEEAARR
jgi:BolA protein